MINGMHSNNLWVRHVINYLVHFISRQSLKIKLAKTKRHAVNKGPSYNDAGILGRGRSSSRDDDRWSGGRNVTDSTTEYTADAN